MGTMDFMGSMSSILGVLRMVGLLLAGSLLYYAVLAIYRVTVHPLAKYPGPLASRMSGWPNMLDCMSGDRHLIQYRYHEKYGPVVRIGPNMLSINTPEALKTIYASNKANVVKGDWYRMISAAEGGWSTHSSIDKEMHSHKRRQMAHAFSDNAMRSAEEFVLGNVRTWTQILGTPKHSSEDDGWSQRRDMSRWACFLSFDLLSDLAFGKRLNCMLSDENRYIPQLVEGFTTAAYHIGYAPFVALVRPLLKTKLMEYMGGQTARDNIKFAKYAQKTMEERVRNDATEEFSNRKDLVHFFLRGKDPITGNAISLTDLQNEACLIIIAGSDTSATTLAALFFYLIHNPRILAKLTAEIRSAFTEVEEIRSSPKLNALTYLRACIDEALRMTPPVGGVLIRKVLPGGLNVEGHHIPAGTEVGTPAYALHHSEKYFPEPFTFKPERWVVDEKAGITAGSVATAQSAFCPFSVGSRGCIGKNLAYTELTLALARALFLYDMRQAAGDSTGEGNPALAEGRHRKGEFQLRDRFVGSIDGPVLEFRGRAATKA